MNWRGPVLRLFRVPAEPEPPPGSPPRVFRAGENYFRLLVIRWGGAQFALLVAAVGLTVVMAITLGGGASEAATEVLIALDVVIWLLFAGHLVFGLAVRRLDYEMRWYMVSDRAIRIREGIVTVREKTMTFANIQNISIRQGPLERLLGIADVEVRTAGRGSSGAAGTHGSKQQPLVEPMHVAYFRGVSNAQEIRDVVREGVRRRRDAGLGDPEDHHSVTAVESVDAVAAATRLLEETRAVRQLLAKG